MDPFSAHRKRDYKTFYSCEMMKSLSNVIQSRLLRLEVSTERAVKKTDFCNDTSALHAPTHAHSNKAPRRTVFHVRTLAIHECTVKEKCTNKKKCRCQQRIISSVTHTHTEALPRLPYRRQTGDASQRGTCAKKLC